MTGQISQIARRRIVWILAVALLSAAVTGIYAQRAQRQYSVAATLSIDEPVPEARRANLDVREFAEQTIAARHDRALSGLDIASILERYDAGTSLGTFITPVVRASRLRDRITATLVDASLVAGIAGEPDLVSVVFTVSAVDPDERIASESLASLLDLYALSYVDAATAEIERRLAAIDREIDQRATRIRALEDDLADIRAQNVEALESSSETAARESALAQSEVAQLDTQVQSLQARDAAIDQALRELDPRGAMRRLAGELGTISSDRLIALQTLAAIERGRNGPDLALLESEERLVRSALEQNANTTLARLAAAQAEYERLQALHALDYPDVVRMANTVSGLETAVEKIGSVGLTGGEIRRIENLAREELALQGELSSLRARRDAARSAAQAIQGRLARTPILLEQIEQLTADLTVAEADLAAATDERSALEYEYGLVVRQNEPAAILSSPPYRPELVSSSRSSTIVAVGAVIGLLLILLVVFAVERVDRRITGAQSIVSIYGKRPVAEIPGF